MSNLLKQEKGTIQISVVDEKFKFSKTQPFTKEGIKEIRSVLDFLETQIEGI